MKVARNINPAKKVTTNGKELEKVEDLCYQGTKITTNGLAPQTVCPQEQPFCFLVTNLDTSQWNLPDDRELNYYTWKLIIELDISLSSFTGSLVLFTPRTLSHTTRPSLTAASLSPPSGWVLFMCTNTLTHGTRNHNHIDDSSRSRRTGDTCNSQRNTN
uniref:Uncharacterized protein n=1 Tax=Timema douglasi TaxID=61478 RepID=A0A7R8VF59_TIMDO|nr:unnamed protein product [Timema douglasi]